MGKEFVGGTSGTMTKIFVYVEGQTEETFVRDTLARHLNAIRIYPIPVLARTKRVKSGRTFKGGITSYRQVKGDVQRLLGDTSARLVTTMIDYYALPRDFPQKSLTPTGNPYQRVRFLEDAFRMDIDHVRFMPFLTLHEFEGLLFSEPEQIASAFPHISDLASMLLQETRGVTSPEEINEGATTHPAARISNRITAYRKPLHGPLIAKRIGLERIRNNCPHFSNWIDTIENITNVGG